MPLETPRWQAILARHETYFPHINPHRPRPLDPLRYLLQSLWLLTTRVPEPEKKVNWRSLAALEGVHGRYTQWLEKLPEQMNARTGHLINRKSWRTSILNCAGRSLGGDLLLAGAGADVYYAAL